MRYLRVFWLFGIIVILFGSCGIMRVSQDKKEKETTVDQNIQLTEGDELKYEYAFVEGVKQKLLGNFSKAMGYFYKCSEIDKDAAAPRYEISQINTMMNDTKTALKYGQEAVKLAPENKWYREHLATLLIKQKQYKEAIGHYEKMIQLDKENLNYYFTLAQLYQHTKNYEKALEHLNTLEERTGVNEQLSVMKQSMYRNLGEKEQAIDEIKKLIEHYPNETRYYGMLAELYAKYQEFGKAEETYNKLFAIDSTNNLGQISKIRYLENSGKFQESINLFISSVGNKKIQYGTKLLIFMNFLDNPRVISGYSNLLHQALDTLSSHYPEKYENHTLYADFYVKNAQYKKAIEELEYLVSTPEEKYIFWDQLLSLYSFTGEYLKMYEYGIKGLEQYTSKPRLYLLTSIGAIQKDKEQEAIDLLKKGLVYIGKNQQLLVDFYTQLAEAYHQIEDYSKSEYYFEKVLNLQPDNVLVLNNYSYYLSLRKEDLDKALEMSKKTIEKEPTSAVYLDTYAWILFQQGKYKKAKKYIEKAIQYGGHKDSDVMEHYGDILYKNGQKEKALEKWKKARSLGGQSAELIQKIENKSIAGEK